ncbi:MAG: FAD-dependent pyridine nucleotide-disulfide oxidoreductase, partial [Candidatus Daviesbacteria bacterium GW2011_GWA1_38_7]
AKIKIVEAMENILPSLSNWTQRTTSQRLKSLGIEVLTNHPIKKIDQKKIYFDSEEINYDYLIWTTGIKGANLDEKINGVEFSKKSQIPVQEDLSLTKYPEVFCIGDLSATAPSTAWSAINQAKTVAKNIVFKLKKESTQKYSSLPSIFVIPVGGVFALTTISGINLSGLIPWILKELIALRYFLTILNPIKALNIWWKGVRIYTKND